MTTPKSPSKPAEAPQDADPERASPPSGPTRWRRHQLEMRLRSEERSGPERRSAPAGLQQGPTPRVTEQYGEGDVLDLHSEEDADRPR